MKWTTIWQRQSQDVTNPALPTFSPWEKRISRSCSGSRSEHNGRPLPNWIGTTRAARPHSPLRRVSARRSFLCADMPLHVRCMVCRCCGICCRVASLAARDGICRRSFSSGTCHAGTASLLRANLLFQVRSTAVIVNAEKKGELPPKAIGLPRPGGETRARPDASDLMAVRQMQRYVDGLTLRFKRGDYRFPSDLYGGVKPEELDRMPEWRDGVQRAIYRALTITTALVGAYREPLFEAKWRMWTSSSGGPDPVRKWPAIVFRA